MLPNQDPQIKKLRIPTPKSVPNIENQYSSSNWIENESLEWVQHNEHWTDKIQRSSPDQDRRSPTKKWEDMIKGHRKRDKIGKLTTTPESTKIQICTDKVQSDTGANQAVQITRNHYMPTVILKRIL